MVRIFDISPYDIEVPERVIAARMGFKGLGKIPDKFKDVYEKVHETALKISKPVVVVDDYAVLVENEEIKIDEIEIPGNLARSQLKKSVKISILLATLGSEIDEEISRLHKNGKEVESFALDAIGSEMIEFAVRYVDGMLRNETELKGSARISPGYADLPISLNLWFYKKLGNYISVRCNGESFTFVPRKTISAFIGWSN